MDIISQSHDKLFKETFGNVTIAADFINNYLPQNILDIISLETLEPQKDSFINKELQEMFADLLFKVNINNNEGYVYFLFEHKSYRDRLAIFQLLRYMIEIWESKIKKENTHGLPIIIPLLIYHNKGKWDIKTNLGDMIAGYHLLPEEIKKYVPNYEYLMYNLGKYSDEEIKGRALTQIVLKVLRDTRGANRDQIANIAEEGIKAIREVGDQDTATQIVVACLRYILSVRDDISKDDLMRIVGEISMEGRELVMTVGEQLIEEGMERGKKEGIWEMAKKSIIGGVDIRDVMRYSGLTKEDIKEIQREIREEVGQK